MQFMVKPVAYLDNTDFDDNGLIINPNIPVNKMPIWILLQAKWCGYCTAAKPLYQQFADNNEGTIFATTIEVDSPNPLVNDLMKSGKLQKIVPNLTGYPTYLVQYQGQTIQYTGGRKTEELQEFTNQLVNFISSK